jgi:hypothetical protein
MDNNSEEKMQVLGMIEQGKIDAKEGLELLNALENKADIVPVGATVKWLRVRVTSEDNTTNVKVNIPISLVDVALRLGTKFAPDLNDDILKNLDINEIMQAIKNGAEGKIVDVQDAESGTNVEVYVE